MPFFNASRKRRKYADGTVLPASTSYPPPYAANATTVLPPEQQYHWSPQPIPYLAASIEPYNSTVSSPSQNQVLGQTQPLHPQHTGSHPQTNQVTLASYEHRVPDDLRSRINDKLGDVISLIDEDAFSGSERELGISVEDSILPEYSEIPESTRAGGNPQQKRPGQKETTRQQQKQVNVFTKLDLYMNSRLPASLPPFRVYMPTWPLLCLAAQYSNSAYTSPQSALEKKDFVSADGRLGTKAMVMKSLPCDDKKTIVFAIRGTSMFSLRDWGVNLATDPVTPAGFLDDQGNLCHSGFLKVAKAMVRPIAMRLRQLLEDNPSRTSCSLLITGHSAGGAVASLLYMHMLSQTVQSDLSSLTGCFKRVHCVTFGAPPISLLPLQKPDTTDGRLRKCLFHSFINEGDPVVRADRAYVRSLVDLLSRPVPTLPSPAKIQNKTSGSALASLGASLSRLDLALPASTTNICTASNKKLKSSKYPLLPLRKLWWDVPPATFSNAGRLVLLRVPDGQQPQCQAGMAKEDLENVSASLVKDEQLRQVIFGEPLVHSMELYAKRIEALAVRAVTGKGGAC